MYNLNPPATTTVVIYTDHPELFEAFIPFFSRFEIVSMEANAANDLLTKKETGHSIKTAIIKQALSSYAGNILYFDTDTYITEPIESLWSLIADNNVVMYGPEGALSAQAHSVYKKWEAVLQSGTITYSTKVFQYTPDFKLWNAAVIGIPSSQAPIIEDVLLLTEKLHQLFPEKHAAQLAYSYCLNTATAVKDVAQKVVHYRRFKELNLLLDVFFKKNEEESIPNLVKLSHHINPKQIQEEKEQYQQLPFYKKWLLTLTGKNWNIQQYLNKI